MKRMTACFLVASVLICGSALAQFENVGQLDFPTSGSPEAQKHFLRGVAILHSFGWKQAIAEFQAAQKLDPDFAMAYWGESLCYNHPLIGDTDLESPRAVLKRLGATREERMKKAPTDREKGFLEAVEILWGEGEIAERKIGYMEAMKRLYDRYPEDDEVATHYSLATIAAVRPTGDTTFRLYVEAGSIAMKVFERNPNHPGAAHYIIHSFDDPVHAPLALPAAWRFAEIAPAVSHARHMPTHIFIQRGMWEQVSKSNQSAYDAAIDLWEPGDSVGDAVHALDWGQYGDLQRGDYEKAKVWMTRLSDLAKKAESAENGISSRNARASRSIPLLRARYIVETESWETKPVTEKSSPHELLATGLSAYKTGDKDLLAQAAAALKKKADEQSKDKWLYNRQAQPTRIMQHEVEALLAHANGGDAEVGEHLMAGIEIVEGMRPPNGAANPVKPIHELAGELTTELGRPSKAIKMYRMQLLRTPNRPRTILGLARAYAAMGDRAQAEAQYRKLQDVWKGYNVPELSEVSSYLSATDAGN